MIRENLHELTVRERSVLLLKARGWANDRIAKRHDCSLRSVVQLLGMAKHKLGFADVPAMLRACRDEGVVKMSVPTQKDTRLPDHMPTPRAPRGGGAAYLPKKVLNIEGMGFERLPCLTTPVSEAHALAPEGGGVIRQSTWYYLIPADRIDEFRRLGYTP